MAFPFTFLFSYSHGIFFILTIKIILRCFGNVYLLPKLFSRREFLCSLVALGNQFRLVMNDVIL